MPEIDVLIVLVLANAAPILTKRVLGDRWSRPLDAGRTLADGQQMLGSAKTVRGVLSGIGVAVLTSWMLRIGVWNGFVIGALSMAGDLASSFVKRRLRLAPGQPAPGLDQVPEAVLPALACHWLLGIGWLAVVVIALAFALIELVISRLDYRFGVGDHPY